MRVGNVILWGVSVIIPVTILIIGSLILASKQPKKRKPGPGSAPIPLLDASSGCGDTAVPCSLDKPECECGFVCTSVDSNDTDYGVEGMYCLPPKHIESACAQVPEDPSVHMQGKLHWTGWTGYDVQDWECACPYSRYYPMGPDGKCTRSSELCRYGNWKYPCKQVVVDGKVTNQCEGGVVGSDPMQNGMCSCDNVTCNDDEDCAGTCVDGVCTGQRLGLSDTGIPECVKDTCRVSVPCKKHDDCPGKSECENEYCASTCTVDEDCGSGGVCTSGKCEWGVWKLSDIKPYVFGTCECPEGCKSKGTICQC